MNLTIDILTSSIRRLGEAIGYANILSDPILGSESESMGRHLNRAMLPVVLFILAALAMACSGSSSEGDMDSTITTDSGLKYKDITVGTGEAASQGATAVVHYTGWLLDGTKFDSSVDRGQTFDFVIGQGRVIAGWEEGVATMNVGGKRELIIPPDLGYGSRGAGGVIPPDATLKFEVELIDLR